MKNLKMMKVLTMAVAFVTGKQYLIYHSYTSNE
jgi:hypothetical protein